MKFGKEFSSQMVSEWQQAYMDYGSLKKCLKDIIQFKKKTNNAPPQAGGKNHHGRIHRKNTLYRACSGLVSTPGIQGRSIHSQDLEEGVQLSLATTAGPPILVNTTAIGGCKTKFMMTSEEGGEYELLFFRRLDDEFNKVDKFYKEKVEEVIKEAKVLDVQMEALIAYRDKVEDPIGWPREQRNLEMTQLASDIATSAAALSASTPARAKYSTKVQSEAQMEAIMEDDNDEEQEKNGASSSSDVNTSKMRPERPAPLDVLDRVKMNYTTETPLSTLKEFIQAIKKNKLEFSRGNLNIVMEMLRNAFIVFYNQKLRLLNSYSHLNVLAFAKILKKYDKITSRNATKPYMKMVDSSFLGSSDEVGTLMVRVEKTFVKHFENGNRTKGMKILRPKAKRERHRLTFSTGFTAGCIFSLIVALAAIIHIQNILHEEGHKQYMDTMFPLYSLFGFIVLHIVMYAANIYYWRRYRVNYSFIFGFKQGTELGFRQVLLVGFSVGVLALLCVIANLDMEANPETKDYEALTELLPLFLLIGLCIVLVMPLNIFYRSNRYFFLTCMFHCLAAPLYKVTLPDFFLGDQLTSQVQALRSIEFYICYYGWGDFKHRKDTCSSRAYNTFIFIVAVIPYASRLLQCLRRLAEEKKTDQGYNGLKYFLTIVAICLRTAYGFHKGQIAWRALAVIFSAIAAIYSTHWDFVHDWGLLNRKSENPWLRDKLLIPQKKVYFIAMVLNVLLRFAWIQTVMDFKFSFMHRQTMITIVASLEIIRRGIWNFFRIENEHLNNVGQYRTSKSVPLPFKYVEDEDKYD